MAFCLAPPTIQISNKLLEDLKKLHDLAQLIPVEKYNFKKVETRAKAKRCQDSSSHSNLKPMQGEVTPIKKGKKEKE